MPQEDDEVINVPQVLDSLVENEVRVIIPKRGSVIAEDGTCRIAIIRPCVSRGRRIMGLPPIYTPEMLEAHAGVFKGWPMYADHLAEALAEMERYLSPDELFRIEEAKKKSRGIFELGGRITASWWDPTIVLPEDEEFGFRPGSVVGTALPQPKVREMIRTDPEVMGCSISAYPKGAKAGRAPWDPSVEGALIEGIVSRPPGSVDWVVRAGAGGRVLHEEEDRRPLAVSLSEALYDLQPSGSDTTHEETMSTPTTPDLASATPAEIASWVAANRPGLVAEAFAPQIEASATIVVERILKEREYVTLADLDDVMQEQRTLLAKDTRDAIAEHGVDVEGEVTRLVEQRSGAEHLAGIAHRLIEGADNLTPGWKVELKKRYVVLPSGPSESLLVEGDEEHTAEELLRESVKADIDGAVALIQEASPGPVVTGQGGGGEESTDTTPALPKTEESALLSWIAESAPGKDVGEVLASIGKGAR